LSLPVRILACSSHLHGKNPASTKPGPDHGSDHGSDHGPDHGPDHGSDHGPDHGSDHGSDQGKKFKIQNSKFW